MATHATDEGIQAIGREIVGDARRMVQLELALARDHAKVTVARGRNALILVGVALSLLFIGFIFWVQALAFALGLLQHPIGYFIVGSALILLALLAGLLGFLTIRRAIRTTGAAVDSIKGDVDWARQLPSRRVNNSS